MKESLRVLLSGVLDYAGLFPPARLPLEQAIANFARYRQEPDAWMLGRFVCPAMKLRLLSAFHDDLFVPGPPFAFSVLGPIDPRWAECREGLIETLQRLKEFRERHPGRVIADVLEMTLPLDLVEASAPAVTAEGLNDIHTLIESADIGDLALFFEFGFEEGERAVATVIEAIAISNRAALPWAGYKLRCGGPVAQSIPTAEQVAFVIRHAISNDVALKVTAGLHHSFPRFDSSVGAKTHGFINVFAAGVLGHARHLEPDMLIDVLRDENAANFVFDETGLSWRVFQASTSEIAAARRTGVTSFGSCSFDEPRADLRTLGWL